MLSLWCASFASLITLKHLQDFIFYAYTFYTGILEDQSLCRMAQIPWQSCILLYGCSGYGHWLSRPTPWGTGHCCHLHCSIRWISQPLLVTILNTWSTLYVWKVSSVNWWLNQPQHWAGGYEITYFRSGSPAQEIWTQHAGIGKGENGCYKFCCPNMLSQVLGDKEKIAETTNISEMHCRRHGKKLMGK